MKPAIVVVDMVKDNLKEGSNHPITIESWAILPNLLRLLKESRKKKIPIIFACDSFMEGDFIFKGKMKQHSLRGTKGSEVADELQPRPTDIVLPKRRFSAFFKTDLDQTLRTFGVDTIVVAGITTEVCVLMTAMDGLCHDFSVILLEDCCASRNGEIHQGCLNLYRDFSLHPLFRIMTREEFLKDVS
ncbi:MAG: cysteine hydrolase [Deltaproteobacteria bacterium]|nr:cysteine hydrolase [Deltaproteobacteria bacterium]MBM4324730.1 cysteine hydrolase [Deltaproteobacteria bacterium]MBM4348126.1 cysteine hydrolase [Deltaproteobacteria bacterium]